MESSLRVPIEDEAGSIVKARFQDFLENYRGENTGPNQNQNEDSTQQRLLFDYMAQIESMIRDNKSTIYVDFQHVKERDWELADAIELEYYRFEPYLRHSLQDVLSEMNQSYVYDIDKGQREFFISFYNLAHVDRIRAMTTEKIGKLMSISGTVTRTSEVRPELLYGSFMCRKCSTMHLFVEQQYSYTLPPICKNQECKDAPEWQLIADKCTFVDWQKLRVQENADEIPPGSMPRCIDVICRNEVVEVAKAGDKVVFTGHVAVLQDISSASRVGEVTVGSKSGNRSDFNDGVTGLKKLGVREMSYKLAFIACSTQHTDQRTGTTLGNAILNPIDGETDTSIDLTEQEKKDILIFYDIYKMW